MARPGRSMMKVRIWKGDDSVDIEINKSDWTNLISFCSRNGMEVYTLQ
jgi:hypothetical protein